MTIQAKLIPGLLKQAGLEDRKSPSTEVFAIDFVDPWPGMSEDTVSYVTANGLEVVLDISKEGNLLGIEIWNLGKVGFSGHPEK